MAADGGKDIKGAKGGESQRKPVEAPDSLNSIASAHILDLLGEGEFAGWYSDNPLKDVFLDETPVMNDDGSMNFTNIHMDWREGTQDQSYMVGFPAVENEIGIGVELRSAAPWTRAINNTSLSAVRVRLSVASLSNTNTSNGDINGYSVRYAIDLATDGGAFEEVLQTAFTGKTTTKYERMHRIDLPAAATGWTIRVRRLTADTEATFIQDTTAVESITEVIDMKLRYPNSALVGIKMDAAQFRNIPTRGYRKLGRLMRIPSNYNPVTRVYTGAWDGTFQIGWTSNPAWIFYDLVTNQRFGLGEYVDETQVDKWSLYQIAQYCDELVPDGKGGMEPRFACTVFFQRQEEAYKVLQDLASVFRGISYWGSGAVIPVGDIPRDPAYTYTNANVKDGKFSYQGSTRRARHTVALVSWSDPSDFNRQKVEYVEDPEGIARYGIQITQITAVGCTSQGQAQRMGRWILLTERFETDTVTFSVGLDQTLVLPGTVIRVADAKRAGRRTGGRVRAATATDITVDFMPVVAIGDDLICITPAGVAEKRPVSNIVGDVITVNPAYSAAPVEDSVWAVESPTLKTQLYSVISIGEGEGLTAVITALQHEPGKYDAVDQGTVIEPRPISDIMSAVQKPPTNLIVTAKDRNSYAAANKVIKCVWTAAEGAVGYDVQWRRDDGDWSSPQRVLGTEAEFFNPFMGNYVCKVVALNGLGIYSVPAVSATFVVSDVSLTPGFVDEINSDIADALLTAQNAQATADGAVVSFWQPDAPTIGSGAGQASNGDIWFDTNDGNRIWRVVSGVWVDAQDDQLAQALAAASTAQSTADGKVKTFFAASAPVASALGDLWFNTVTKKLFRWNGASWNDEIADVTLDQLGGNGVNLLPDQYSTYEASSLPAITVSPVIALARTTDGNSVIKNSLYMGTGASTAWLGSGFNIPLTPGKRYLVSFWASSSQAGNTFRPFIETASGYTYGASLPVDSANVFKRVSTVVDMSANTQSSGWLGITKEQSEAGYIDGLMVEEMIGRMNSPSAYTRGTSSGQAISALIAAQNAQATADGNIDIYRQSDAPVGAKLGDYWQDSDDGKWWYWNGSAWIESPDSRLPQVIADLQNTNGVVATKTRLFSQEDQPTATANGDIWYVPSTKITRYWNGTAWSLLTESATAVIDNLVLNGAFEQGAHNWTFEGYGTGTYVEASTNAALSGTGAVFSAAGGQSFRIYQNKLIPCQPGQVVMISASINNVGNAATGDCGIELLCYDVNGGFFATRDKYYSQQGNVGASTWRTVTKRFTIPEGCVGFRVGVRTINHTAGYWGVDSVRADFSDAKPAAPPAAGDNMVINGSFGSGEFFTATQADRKVGSKIVDGWQVGTNNGTSYSAAILTGTEVNQSGQGRNIFIGDQGGTIPVGYTSQHVVADDLIPVKAGWVLTVQCSGQVDKATAYTANCPYYTYGGYWMFDIAGNNIGYQGMILTNQSGGWNYESSATLPGACAFIRPLVGLDINNATGAPLTVDWAVHHGRWNNLRIVRQVTLDEQQIAHGSIYGKTANEDLYDVSSIRRIGLSVKGSRKILGGARNSRASLVAGITSVRTATALSADSAGNVTINAHSVEISGETVTYNAVTNAITGLTQNVTYVIYTLDPYLDGGTRTYYAQTSVLSAQQAGEGAVHIGNITIPASGSSSGGGGGTGDPSDWCVDAEMVLPDGRAAAGIDSWHGIPCWNDNVDQPGIVHLPVESNQLVPDQPCHMIVTTSGASVIASDSTPMTLRDGRTVRLPEMHGEDALVRSGDGTIKWEQVVKCVPMGLRTVAKIKVHQRCYFAGLVAGATIATHNPTQKP